MYPTSDAQLVGPLRCMPPTHDQPASLSIDVDGVFTVAKKKKSAKKATKTAAPNYKFDKTGKVRSKGQIYDAISANTGLARKDVAKVFDCFSALISKDLKKPGPQAVNVPGLMKITVKRKPATKARKGINPFTGQEIMIKAKPACNVVKVRPLKALKDMV